MLSATGSTGTLKGRALRCRCSVHTSCLHASWFGENLSRAREGDTGGEEPHTAAGSLSAGCAMPGAGDAAASTVLGGGGEAAAASGAAGLSAWARGSVATGPTGCIGHGGVLACGGRRQAGRGELGRKGTATSNAHTQAGNARWAPAVQPTRRQPSRCSLCFDASVHPASQRGGRSGCRHVMPNLGSMQQASRPASDWPGGISCTVTTALAVTVTVTLWHWQLSLRPARCHAHWFIGSWAIMAQAHHQY